MFVNAYARRMKLINTVRAVDTFEERMPFVREKEKEERNDEGERDGRKRERERRGEFYK